MRCSKTTGRRRGPWLAAIAVLVVGLGAAGCATVPPAGGAREGALPGTAASPPASGWISGDGAKQDLKRAAAGAGVAELANGSVGYYMDVQESKLREQLEGSGVGVTRRGDDVTLIMPGSVAFASDSADLNGAFVGVLGRIAGVLKKYDKTVIEIAGHTDSTGSREHNQALSQRRAAAVAAYLGKQGILKSRIVTVGAGETHPIASNDSADGRARNRRVELTLSPLSAGRG